MTTGGVQIGRNFSGFVSISFSIGSSNLLVNLYPGVFLLKNLRRAVRWSNTQRSFASAISERHPASVITRWEKMRKDFDSDPKKPNPYVEPRVRKSTTTCYFLYGGSFHMQMLL
jgi:hypothetical protein